MPLVGEERNSSPPCTLYTAQGKIWILPVKLALLLTDSTAPFSNDQIHYLLTLSHSCLPTEKKGYSVTIIANSQPNFLPLSYANDHLKYHTLLSE